jgi:hypothetical protein
MIEDLVHAMHDQETRVVYCVITIKIKQKSLAYVEVRTFKKLLIYEN